MADVTAEFFDRLAERGTVPGFARTTGSVRFELTRGDQTEHWRVAFKRGAVTVDRGRRRGRLRRPHRREHLRRPCRWPGQRHGLVAPRPTRATASRNSCPLPAALPGADERNMTARRLGPSASGGADDGDADGPDPRRQHLRRVRRARRLEASPTEPTGLFSFDTRFLSNWVLTINGQKLNSLSTDDLQYFESRFFLVPGTGTVYIDAKLSVIRERVGGRRVPRGADDPQPRERAGRPRRSGSMPASDFADLFEVKDALKKVGDLRHASRTAGCTSSTSARRSSARPSSRPRRRPASTSTA